MLGKKKFGGKKNDPTIAAYDSPLLLQVPPIKMWMLAQKGD